MSGSGGTPPPGLIPPPPWRAEALGLDAPGLVPDFIAGLQERLLADQIDMIVGAITIIDRTLPFEIERLMEDTNVIVCRTGHRLGRAMQIRSSDLEGGAWIAFSEKWPAVAGENGRLGALWAGPNNDLGRELEQHAGIALTRENTALDLMKRPEVTYAGLMALPSLGPGVRDPRVAEQVEIGVKYSGYLERQREEIDKQRRHEDSRFPDDFRFDGIPGLSAELQAKLGKVRPETIGQAQRIPGMTPAAISLLLVHLAKRRRVA